MTGLEMERKRKNIHLIEIFVLVEITHDNNYQCLHILYSLQEN